MFKKQIIKLNNGTITPAMLILSATFIIVIYGLVFLLTNQLDLTFRQTAFDQALYIAESGIQYYRWHLAHAPNDFTDGTGGAGPYIHDYYDPQGKVIGKYSLTITPPALGSSIVTIKTTGWLDDYPAAKRIITAKYGIPSLTKYSNLTHAASWYGTGITVNGQVHSNTGIRMDGLNTSIVSNTQNNYTCGSETGCNDRNSCRNPCTWSNQTNSCTCPGVWGAGAGSSLWQYPSVPVDFDAISFDFAQMRNAAQTNNTYFGPSNRQGYQIIFNNTGTASIYRVDSTSSYWGYSVDGGCQRLYQRISSRTPLATLQLNSSPIIFIEDTVWVEGIVNGKTTVVAAKFPIDSNTMNIWINGNITYLAKNGQHNLGLIAQKDIYFIRNLPNNFEINAALMAQKGKIIRHGYLSSCGASSEAVKNSLTIYGSVISNQKSYWNFGSPPSSGFTTRTMTYDASLLFNPPPYFPTDGDYEFISWEE